MENGAFRLYGKSDGRSSPSIRSITEDDAGNIYLGTTQGLACVAPTQGRDDRRCAAERGIHPLYLPL
ncbi:MAG: hypothetical protein IJ055_04710 [Oscillospiraceae bacterium]|nr:hypothetical protein [Oscillospiraceae bacterium]